MIAGLWLLFQAAMAPPPSDSSVVVVPGARYQAGGLHRFFLGDTHRDLWATPIRVPVLDLARFGGGLTAYEKGGSSQSRSLRFRGEDGRVYSFRALEKDPTQTWPPALRASAARKFAEDQISALFPTAAVAVAVLERAAGLVNPGVFLAVLPDDERLGAWRGEFAGLVGTMEQRLRGRGPSIRDVPGATQVIATDALFRRLRERKHVVDQRAFLAARLFDLVIGDWDRHEDQWSWARFRDDDDEGVSRWVPLPRDRDWALSRLDGPLYSLLRLYLPKYQSFGPRYGRVYGMTLSAEPLDRRLLTGLESPVWDSVTRDLQARLTDLVIDSAVAALPPELPAAAVAELAASLRSRRDRLPEVADRFYRQLATAVDLLGTESKDVVTATVGPAGDLTLELPGPDSTVRFSRRFLPKETDEVRLHLFEGRDSLRWLGEGRTPIRLRVIDPEGVAIPLAARPFVSHYDSTASRPAAVDSLSPFTIPRDWGALYGVAPWFEARPGIGMLLGGGPVFYRYGFRKQPYAARVAVRAAWASGVPGFGLNADLEGDFRFEHPGRRLLVRAGYLRIDVTRYFGVGNETARSPVRDYDHVHQELYLVEPRLELAVGTGSAVSVGAFARASQTDLDRPSVLAEQRPYGSGSFKELGLTAGFAHDTRDHARYPTRGIRAELETTFAPGLLDVARPFGRIDGLVTGYSTAAGLPARPTLAVRLGGSQTIGRVPFFEAASLGGRSSVRGLNSHRFLGDASVYGSAELRLDLGDFTVLLPGEWGVYGLGDVGRVFVTGERSDRWHDALGLGLWFAFLDRSSTMTVTYARSEERSRLYIQAGFHY